MLDRIILGGLIGFLAVAVLSAQVTLGQEPSAPATAETKQIICPKCKTETLATKRGGGVHLETRMLCPDCKGKGTATSPHVCGKCGTEIHTCSVCDRVIAHVTEKPAAQMRCPTCKEVVTATKKGGGVRLEREMKCPSCKEKTGELGVFECERCKAELLSCAICGQYSGVISKEEPAVELKCPNCKELVTATKRGGGVSLEKEMRCPHCKKDIKDLDAHTCSKCGADLLLCPMCKKPM
jgi:phage FluMu protein Com